VIAGKSGDRKKSYELFRKAADREGAMLYTEPPSYPRPVAESMANVALSLGDYAVADKGYRETLGREPGSGRAYFGLAAALDGEGKTTEAHDTLVKATKAWARADANLPQVQKLKQSTAAIEY
jgi:tetratricopeptide (TPR) repeat protein